MEFPNNNPFSIKPIVVKVKISQKKNISFFGLISHYNRLANRKNGYSGAFPYKVTPDIDFTDEVVVQCDVPDVKVVLVIYK